MLPHPQPVTVGTDLNPRGRIWRRDEWTKEQVNNWSSIWPHREYNLTAVCTISHIACWFIFFPKQSCRQYWLVMKQNYHLVQVVHGTHSSINIRHIGSSHESKGRVQCGICSKHTEKNLEEDVESNQQNVNKLSQVWLGKPQENAEWWFPCPNLDKKSTGDVHCDVKYQVGSLRCSHMDDVRAEMWP